MGRDGRSGRFREFNSQKISSKTRFDRKFLGKHHGIGSFAKCKGKFKLRIEDNTIFICVYIVFKAKSLSKLVKNGRKYLSLTPGTQKEKYFFHLLRQLSLFSCVFKRIQINSTLN